MHRWSWMVVSALTVGLLGGARPVAAQTVLLTNEAQMAAPVVIDFNSLPDSVTNGPVQVGTPVGRNITWEASSGGISGHSDTFGLGENGLWNYNKSAYQGFNGFTSSMTFRFLDGPVNAVGGFVNYFSLSSVSGDNPTIEVLGEGDIVLGSFNLAIAAPISTPGGINAGAFRGIARSEGDIHAFRLRNDFMVLDDLRFTATSSVPEPSAALLFLPALGVVAFIKRRRS